MTFLSGGKQTLEIPVAAGENMVMDSRPVIFDSEVSFSVISKKAIEESRATEDVVDDDDDDNNDGNTDDPNAREDTD